MTTGTLTFPSTDWFQALADITKEDLGYKKFGRMNAVIAFKIGDTVTATWDNTSSGDNNSDTISTVTVNFTAFGGGSAVSASNSSGTWTATYTIVSGSVLLASIPAAARIKPVFVSTIVVVPRA